MKGCDKMPILFGLTFIIIVFLAFSKSRDKNAKKNSESFWQKERSSHFVPKQDISGLDYLTIPYDSLPFRFVTPGGHSPVPSPENTFPPEDGSANTNEGFEFSVESPVTSGESAYVRAAEHTAPLAHELSATERELCNLSDSKILNLTGISNTELRLTYGTANLDLLTAYDQNFTTLIRTLQKWGTQLVSAGNPSDAITVLSYAVSIGSDIAGTYALLARLYKEQGQLQKIEELKVSAEALTTLMKPSILRDLEQISEQTP